MMLLGGMSTIYNNLTSVFGSLPFPVCHAAAIKFQILGWLAVLLSVCHQFDL